VTDWEENIRQGLLGDSAQYRQGIKLVRNLQNQGVVIDRFVGHSLGGGLASAAALVYNLPATTFNAAGVNPDFVAQFGANLGQANQLIDAYRVQGDILSTLQEMSPMPVLSSDPLVGLLGLAGEMMPDGTGKPLWLPGHSFSPLARHSMDEVLAGMREMM